MELKIPEEDFKSWKSKNTDDYGREIFRYAESWADMMEKRMAKGEKLEDIAQSTSHEADTDGITGYMYGMAVAILTQTWKYGDALKVWHNTKYGRPDAEGVVNPAVICIEEP